MLRPWFLLSAPAVLALASCAAVPPAGTASGECPITGSSDWAAWVNAMPGPNARPTLIATGKVVVPTGGYTFAWRDLRVMESYPTQVVAELEALPPEAPATQAVETHDLRGEWTIDQPVGSFTIRCGDRTLARISPVETAR
jgi:hypothetical protein